MEIQPTTEEIRGSLAKVVASPGFTGAGRLGPFLTFLVDRALSGETDGLKESVLGVEVFQRAADYDPRTDPIVRVEARRLRARLEEYYAGPGSGDAVRINLPKGGYVPVFSKAGSAAPPAESRRSWVAGAVGLAAVGAAGGGWWLWSRRKPAAGPRIAVLPFVNLSEDKANEYLSDGLTEELIDRLAKVPGLKVASRGMVFQFKGAKTDIREIASRLGATAIVEGSVRRQDRRLRISARLVEAEDGSPIWSNTYDREMADIFSLQEELASAIANALRVELRRAPGEPSKPAISLEAYNLHLQAKYQMNLYSEDGFRRATGYLEECLKLQPHYAPALADLSIIYSLFGYYGVGTGSANWARARQYADEALSVNRNLAAAWSAKGLEAGFNRWQWEEARRACEEAVELDPASALAHSQLAIAYLLPKGRVDEAIKQFERAIELDPLFSFAQYVLGFAYLSAGRLEEAARQYKKTIELSSIHPDIFWDYGMALGYLKKYAEARKAFEQKRRLSGQRPEDLGGLEAWFAGDFEKAIRDAAGVEKSGREGRDDLTDVARYYAVLGEKEKALEWLERAYEKRKRQTNPILREG
jgi:serine/threonine-protein kinase